MKNLKKAPAAKVTRVIAGHSITLSPGRNYLAARPMAARGRRMYPVRITSHEHPFAAPFVTVQGLSYDQANDLINEFNNGPTSFHGRNW